MSAYMMLWMHVLFTHPKMCMALKIITLQIRVYYFVKSSERIAGLSALFCLFFLSAVGIDSSNLPPIIFACEEKATYTHTHKFGSGDESACGFHGFCCRVESFLGRAGSFCG